MPFSQHVASTPPAEGHFLQPFGRERPFPRSFSIALPPLEKEAATRLEKKEEGEEREREKKGKGKLSFPSFAPKKISRRDVTSHLVIKAKTESNCDGRESKAFFLRSSISEISRKLIGRWRSKRNAKK